MNPKLFKKEHNRREFTAEELITSELDGADYDRGAVEAAAAEADNCKRCLGRLVQVLYNKRIISRADVWAIADMKYMADKEQL